MWLSDSKNLGATGWVKLKAPRGAAPSSAIHDPFGSYAGFCTG